MLRAFRSHISLALITILHAFTHAYGAALVPLYLLIVVDMKLRGIGEASLIVTIYGLVYCLGSYAAGVLADRFDRKWLLGVGLFGNALAMIGMGLTRQYEMLIVLAVLGGVFGTLFHPSANALVPAHYPKSPGMAIGLLGIGSGLGFFFGPQYAGWRAQTATWHFGLVADWQRPCIELGLMGIVAAIVFMIFAREVKDDHHHKTEDAVLPNRVAIEAIVTEIRSPHSDHPQHLTSSMRNKVIAIAIILGCRDFAGVASLSLLSIYLQKAFDYSTKQAGFVVGGMMLLSVIVNPLAVYASPHKRRLPALVAVLVGSSIFVAMIPLLPIAWVLPAMCIFEAGQMSSYSISDAAMLERVSPRVRGRVNGLFLMLAGTFGSLSPWAMGFWTDILKDRAHEPLAYLPIFGTLGGMMIVASFSVPIIGRLSEQSPRRRLTQPVGAQILKNLQ
jgi:MFS family permease